MDIKTINIDKLSNYIRQINGDNRMDAGTLAEKIVQYLYEQSPAVEPAIQVKPLEWVVCGDELHALKKNYKIREVHDRHSLYFRGGLFGRYPSLDEAKEAAQKDYDSKILSCLSVTAKPEPVECEPVAEVLWYEPILHEPQTKQGHKIIDASMAWMDRAPLGTKLYERPPHGIDAETRAMVLELLTVLDYAMFEFADTEQKVRELKNKIRERIRS